MKRVRIFAIEILGVPILLAWLFIQYPDVFNAAVPWIAFAVLWHLTWEFVIDPVRIEAKSNIAKLGRLKTAVWIVIAIGLSLVYLGAIETAMINLAYNYHDSIALFRPVPATPPLFAYDHTPKPIPSPAKPIRIAATFYTPQSPSIVVSNQSGRVADGVAWFMLAFRTSDLGYFGFTTQSVGYIKPHSTSAPYQMDLPRIAGSSDGSGPLKDGDELTGSVSIDCPQCEIQTYIVHFVWGHSGWFFESPQKAGYIVPKDMTKDGRAKYIKLFTGDTFAKARIEIKLRPPS
jgi:hypothetical protein